MPLPQFVSLLAAYEQAFLHQQDAGSKRVEGCVRIIAPPTVSAMFRTSWGFTNPRGAVNIDEPPVVSALVRFLKDSVPGDPT